MKFWRKFWLFILAIITSALLQLFVKEIGRFEFSVCGRDFSIGIYVICLVLLSFWFVCFTIKSFFVWFLSLFFKNKTAEEIKSINGIARLVVSDDYEFSNLFDRTTVIDSMKILKIALALKRNLGKDKNFEKTGIHYVDILIIKNELEKLLNSGDLNSLLNLASKVVKNYAEDVNVLKDQLLEVAKRARKNFQTFSFEPSKFKYNLPQSFINEYHVALGIVDFELEGDQERKLKILERLHREYPANIDVLCRLLDFASEKFDDKKVLEIIENTISINPNRKLTEYLLKINKNDIFEIAQSMMSEISENNIEKLWILLIIAVEKKFLARTKELVKKISEIDRSRNIFEFFAKHFEFMSSDPEIVSIIRRMEK